MTIISSQHHIDWEIVEEKMEALKKVLAVIEQKRSPPQQRAGSRKAERGKNMKKELIMKKLHNVNTWVVKAREEKDWETYEQAVMEYTRLTRLLEEAE